MVSNAIIQSLSAKCYLFLVIQQCKIYVVSVEEMSYLDRVLLRSVPSLLQVLYATLNMHAANQCYLIIVTSMVITYK